MHLLAKIATKFNLVTPDFQKLPGGMPPDSLRDWNDMLRMPYS